MKSRDSVFWLAGYLEAVAADKDARLDQDQVETIKARLSALITGAASQAEGVELAAAVDKGDRIDFRGVAARFLGGNVILQED